MISYMSVIVLSNDDRKYRCKFTTEETVMFCLRVMVGVIILYDHVHPVGAFAKTSPIDVSIRSETATICDHKSWPFPYVRAYVHPSAHKKFLRFQ